MIPGLAKLPYVEWLKLMKIPSLVYRRLRGDSIEIYRYMHNIYEVYSETLLPAWKSEGLATRGHQLRLQKRHCKSKIRANFCSYKMVNAWNRLPEKVVLSHSVNCFKGRFDAFFWENCNETDLDLMLSNAFSRKFHSLDEDDKEYQDSVFDWSSDLGPTATDDDDDGWWMMVQ